MSASLVQSAGFGKKTQHISMVLGTDIYVRCPMFVTVHTCFCFVMTNDDQTISVPNGLIQPLLFQEIAHYYAMKKMGVVAAQLPIIHSYDDDDFMVTSR